MWHPHTGCGTTNKKVEHMKPTHTTASGPRWNKHIQTHTKTNAGIHTSHTRTTSHPLIQLINWTVVSGGLECSHLISVLVCTVWSPYSYPCVDFVKYFVNGGHFFCVCVPVYTESGEADWAQNVKPKVQESSTKLFLVVLMFTHSWLWTLTNVLFRIQIN